MKMSVETRSKLAEVLFSRPQDTRASLLDYFGALLIALGVAAFIVGAVCYLVGEYEYPVDMLVVLSMALLMVSRFFRRNALIIERLGVLSIFMIALIFFAVTELFLTN
jgi:hypothetical protein